MGRFVGIYRAIGVIAMLTFMSALLGGCFGGEGGEPSTLSIDCGQRVTGAERNIELSSEGIVEVQHETRQVEVDGDGMTGFADVYTFTGIAAGDVCATVYDFLPWHDEPGTKGGVDRRVYLHVNEQLEVAQVEVPDFEKVELTLFGTTAQARFYVATAENGLVRMNAYEAMFGEDPPSEGELVDCYSQVAMLLARCDIERWDGYSGNNPHALDGDGFNLTVTRADGSKLRAHGTNATPDGFRTFEKGFVELFR